MLRKRVRWILTSIVAVGILVLSLIPKVPPVMGEFTYADKVGHLLAYFVLGLFLFRAMALEHRKQAFFITVACCVAYGGLIEVIQHFVGREMELLDMTADLLGTLAGAGVGALLLHRRAA